MWKHFCVVLVVFLSYFDFVKGKNVDCKQDPFELNEEFLSCCQGKPTFPAEYCIDTLLENNTFSQECLVECMYKNFTLYDGGNGIDLNGVETFTNASFDDADVRAMFVNAFERCSKFDKESLRQLFSFVEMPNEHNCDAYPAYVDQCLWYHTLAFCPQTLASDDDEECATKMEWVQTCLFK